MREEDHGHALRPIQEEIQTSLFGKHKMSLPATAAEVQALFQSLSHDIHDIKCSITSLSGRFDTFESRLNAPTVQVFHTYPGPGT